jgi:hypothetical protein
MQHQVIVQAGATYAWSNGATTAANTTTVPKYIYSNRNESFERLYRK